MRILKKFRFASLIASVTGISLLVFSGAAAWYSYAPQTFPLPASAQIRAADPASSGRPRSTSILTQEKYPSPSATQTAAIGTSTAGGSAFPAETRSQTATLTETPTATRTPTSTPSLTKAPYYAPTKTKSSSSNPPASKTPTSRPSKTATPRPTRTYTATIDPSTATPTALPGTATKTPTASTTPTPSMTPTVTDTPQPSSTPTATNTPKPATATSQGPVPTATVDLSGCGYATHSSFEGEILTLINNVRQQNGVAKLNMQSQLRAAAREHSADMVCNQQYSHTGSNGTTSYDRITAHGYWPTFWGENFYVGWQTTPQEAFDWWMNSTPHRNNILSPNYVHIGIGHGYYNNRNGYTLNFGRP